MKAVITIWKKETLDYFISPIAYLVIAIFLLITGWFFFSTFFVKNQANLRDFFNLLPITFSFIIPALTMRLFAEEFSGGTDEILITMPLNTWEIITGKYLASLTLVAAMLLPTLAYPLSISFFGELDLGPVLGGYLGSIFLGGAFCSIGILTSSLTRSQIIAFILSTLICLLLTLISQLLFFFPQGLIKVLNQVSSNYHFQNIAKGIIDSRDLLYFLSLNFIALYLTNMNIQAKQ